MGDGEASPFFPLPASRRPLPTCGRGGGDLSDENPAQLFILTVRSFLFLPVYGLDIINCREADSFVALFFLSFSFFNTTLMSYELAIDSAAGDGRRLPVGKMLCLGKNYVLHAKEMGGEAPEEPVIFMKPRTAFVPDGGTVVIPPVSDEMHHELELVVVIGAQMKNVSEEEGMRGVLGYAVGLDMTLRDVQSRAKKRGEPWTVAKAFDTSAPISSVIPKERIPDPHDLHMTLAVNGEVRQQGYTGDMIFRIPFTVSYLSRIFTLEPGDCIFTGTPEGVGQVVRGDRLIAGIEGLARLEVHVDRSQ